MVERATAVLDCVCPQKPKMGTTQLCGRNCSGCGKRFANERMRDGIQGMIKLPRNEFLRSCIHGSGNVETLSASKR